MKTKKERSSGPTHLADECQRRILDIEHVLVYAGQPSMCSLDAFLHLWEIRQTELVARTENHMVNSIQVRFVRKMNAASVGVELGNFLLQRNMRMIERLPPERWYGIAPQCRIDGSLSIG